MANYQLQVENLRYDPTAWLTEVDKNLERAKQEHRAAEIAYGEMQSKADMFEKLANDVQGKDSQAYQNYINFAKTLRQHTDLLATQGVNPALWRNLIQAKSDYSRIIHPIEEAWNARDREAQRQAKYLEQHPHAIFEKDARDMGIDQWLKNPHYVAKSIDREIVANRAMERYKALQKQVMEMVSQSGMTPDAISRMTPTQVHAYVKQNAPYLYEAIEKRGVSPEEVQRFMAGDPTAIGSILTNVMDETLGMYGLSNWNTDYDHFTLDQNRRRRDNINNMLKSTVIGESTNAIGDSEFKQYKDDISGNLAVRWAELEEQKRHNKAIEGAAGNKSKGSAVDKWKHYWQNAGSTADTEEEIAEPTAQYNIRAFIKAQPDLAKTLTRDEWNNILEEIAKENQLSSSSAVTVDKYMNQIVDKATKIKQKHIEDYNKWFNKKNSLGVNVGIDNINASLGLDRYDAFSGRKSSKSSQQPYNDDGSIRSQSTKKTSIITDHEDYMNKNVRVLYANKKSPGVGEADEDEVLANMTKGNNKTFVTSNLGPEDIKYDIAPLANMIAGDKKKKANLNLFLNEDGVPYEGDTWFSDKDQEGFIDEVLGLANGTIKNGKWSKSYDFDTKGRAHIRLNVNGKETFVSPEIIGIPGGTKYAQKMLDILTESEKILRSKATTVAAKAAAETRKTAAQAGLGYILGADKDWHTKPDANGYDGDKKFIEEELAAGLNELFPNMTNN